MPHTPDSSAPDRPATRADDEFVADLAGASTEPDLDELAPSADLVRVYLDGIGRTPLLTAAEEVELAKRIEAGVYAAELLRRAEGGEEVAYGHGELRALAADGQAAKAHMLRANLRLVVSVAKRYAHRGLPFLDVVQEGNLGLIRAVEKFDYRKGYKFSTYAMWWIRQAIGRGMAEQSRAVRLPVHLLEQLSKVTRAQRDLGQELGREPTAQEIAAVTGHTPERVEELRRVSRDPVSLDTPVGDDGDSVLGDLVLDATAPAPAEMVERQAVTGELERVIDTLPEREALIIRMRYGLYDGQPRTLEEIARHLGLTRERIRQLEKEALVRLRHPSSTRQLLDLAS
jgi:RNA polymerase primary sigma factor